VTQDEAQYGRKLPTILNNPLLPSSTLMMEAAVSIVKAVGTCLYKPLLKLSVLKYLTRHSKVTFSQQYLRLPSLPLCMFRIAFFLANLG